MRPPVHRVVVGMAGPFGLLRVHDVRDWAQRERHCHDFFSHRRPLWLDAFWQFACKFERPPTFVIEPERDRWYRRLERTWMLQQLPIAALLFWLGGLPTTITRSRNPRASGCNAASRIRVGG